MMSSTGCCLGQDAQYRRTKAEISVSGQIQGSFTHEDARRVVVSRLSRCLGQIIRKVKCAITVKHAGPKLTKPLLCPGPSPQGTTSGNPGFREECKCAKLDAYKARFLDIGEGTDAIIKRGSL